MYIFFFGRIGFKQFVLEISSELVLVLHTPALHVHADQVVYSEMFSGEQ
jgi:hypothetical protein